MSKYRNGWTSTLLSLIAFCALWLWTYPTSVHSTASADSGRSLTQVLSARQQSATETSELVSTAPLQSELPPQIFLPFTSGGNTGISSNKPLSANEPDGLQDERPGQWVDGIFYAEGHDDEYLAKLTENQAPFEVTDQMVRAAAANNVGGSWGPVIDWPHIPVSIANLPDGRILTFSGSQRLTWPTTEQSYTAAWDPISETFSEYFNDNHNMFCADLVSLTDGRVFVNGGRNTVEFTTIFNPVDNNWTRVENMNDERWYPTSIALPEGGVFTAVGRANRYPEVWEDGQGWRRLAGADLQNAILDYGANKDGAGWWPLMHLDPRGKILHYGATPEMHSIDTTGNGSITSLGPNNFSWFPEENVAIQFDESRILVAGGAQSASDGTSSNQAAIVDMSNPQPQIIATNNMQSARQHANEVVLPSGEVLVIGGSTTGQKFSDNGAVLEPEVWNPQTGQWTLLNPMNVPRTYHSTAILLLDGRVLSAGGGYSSRNANHPASHPDGQVFSPPYLYNASGALATRPEIGGAPDVTGPGGSFTVSASQSISRFTMVRMSATTHTMNTGQRFVEVSFTGTNGTYQLTMNTNKNVLLPGYWMLFALNNDGVPSVAKSILVSTSNNPTVTNPGDQFSGDGDSINLAILAGSPNGSPISYAASGLPPGLSINATTGLISGSLDGVGAYNVTITVTNGTGGTDSVGFTWNVYDPNAFFLTADFDASAEGFVYIDDAFRNTNQPAYASGDRIDPGGFSGGALRVQAGGINNNSINNISGGWRYTFFLAGAQEVVLSLRYKLDIYGGYEPDEFGQALVSVDGQLVGEPPNDYLVQLVGNGPSTTSGWQLFTADLGVLQPGNHTLIVGAYNNKKTYNAEITTVLFDDLNLTGTSINNPPTLSAIADQVSTVGESISLPLSASDPDEDAMTFSASGLPAGLTLDANSGLIDGLLSTAGTFNSTITVSDGNGGTDSTSFAWVVEPAPQISIADITTLPEEQNSPISYTASASGGGGTLRYRWLFGDNTPETANSTSPSISHSFSQPGRYIVTLTVTDNSGQEVSTTFYQAIYSPHTAGAPSRSTSIRLEERTNSDRLWVVNPDNNTVSVFNTVNNNKLAEIPVGAEPRAVAIAPDGRIWVTNQESATITIIDDGTLTVAETVSLPHGSMPFGLAFDTAGSSAFVALEATGLLLKLNPSNGSQTGSVPVGPSPRHLAITADGGTVYVSRFITPLLPGEETATIDTNNVGGEVVAINAGTMSIDETIVLAVDTDSDFEVGARGVPNYLGAPVISPDGQSAWVPSKQDNVLLGGLRDGQPQNFEHSVRSISSYISLPNNSEDFLGRIDYDNASLATAGIFGPNGNFLFVALETSREVAVVDAYQRAELFRFDAGRAPQGLALSADGLTLYVHNFMDRSIGLYDLAALINQGIESVSQITTYETVAVEILSAQVLNGKQLFYDAKDPRLALDAYMSCASCHNDGGHDGRVWDFTDVGEGLRNTISLEGRGGPDHGRLHWSANFDEVHDFEGQIRAFSGGTGLMSDPNFAATSDPLGPAKAGLSADLDALAAYVNSLTTVGGSPYRTANGDLTAEGEAGRTIFAEQNCSSCHGGDGFTDSPTNALHDIGTIKPSSGQRLGLPLPGLDTPTLRGLWATAPYLHDGSAATLEDAVQAHDGLNLTAGELNQLVAYLNQIDDSEPAPAPPIITQLGDVNCSGTVDAVDAMAILQYTVGGRTDVGACPLTDTENTLNLSVGDVNGSGGGNPVDSIDALFILQCQVGAPNAFCPE